MVGTQLDSGWLKLPMGQTIFGSPDEFEPSEFD